MPVRHPNMTDKYVGSRVRLLRGQHNMTQQTLAERLSMSFQQVQKYEKGINRIGASRLRHLGQIFDVPVNFFFEGAPHLAAPTHDNEVAVSTDAVTDFIVSAEGQALARAFPRITDAAVRRSVVRMVEALAKS
jgi:transcriptional regulator with XRE-family HTH domain